MRKRKQALILALTLTIGLVMTGCGAFTDIDKVPDYLTMARMTGRSAEGPVPLKLRVDIDSNWDRLIRIIENSGVRVNLDLSRSRMTNTTFNPRDNESRYVISLVLPNSVTAIAGDFSGFSRLTAIRFPASTEIRGANPFAGCSSLTFNLRGRGDLRVIENGRVLVNNDGEIISYPSATGNVTFNDTTIAITAVGARAFARCANLQSVEISSAELIRDGAFYDCENLRTVNLPAVTTIGARAFENCENLFSVNLSNVVTIGDEAFSGCIGLHNISLPAATTIGARAFRGCENLATLNLPAARTIRNEAFYGNINLQTLSIPSAVTIGNSVAANTGTTNLTITVGDRIETIGTSMFNEITRRKNVTLRVPQDEVANFNTMRDALRGRGWSNGTFTLSAGQNQTTGTGWSRRTYWVNNFNTNIFLTVEGY